MKRTKNFVL